MTLNKKWFILFLFTLQKFDTWQNGKSLAWQHATTLNEQPSNMANAKC
jgi:hypothetical protein